MIAESCLRSASVSPPTSSVNVPGFVNVRAEEGGTCTALPPVCCLLVSVRVFVRAEMLNRGICCLANPWP